MGSGFQAMQLTEVHKGTDSTNAFQSMAGQQQLRASVDELSKEFMSYAIVTAASARELHQNMVNSCRYTQQELHRWATDLESRLTEALDRKVPTVDAVSQSIDTKLALYHAK
eukprot:130068-Lingulodinium_polyedra.AAC.1